MKYKCYQFLNSLIHLFKREIRIQQLIISLSTIIKITVEELEIIVNNYLINIQDMNKDDDKNPDYNYGTILYQMLLMISRLFARAPFTQQFIPIIKK